MKTFMVTAAVLASGVSGCAYQDLSDTCVYAEGQPFYQYRPDELSLVVGSPQYQMNSEPWLALREQQDDLAIEIPLQWTQTPANSASSELANKCYNVEVREFELEIENEAWSEYWSSAQGRGTFSMTLAMPGLASPVYARSFGFAVIVKGRSAPSASCGCFAK